MVFIIYILKLTLIAIQLHDEVLGKPRFLQYKQRIWLNFRRDSEVGELGRSRPIAPWTTVPRGAGSSDIEGTLEDEAKGPGATAVATPTTEGKQHSEGINDTMVSNASEGEEDENNFNSKVMAAMKKFGVGPIDGANDSNCKDGVCEIPSQKSGHDTAETSTINDETEPMDEKVEAATAAELSNEMNVSESMAFAALAAAKGNKDLAKEIIQYERSATSSISDESPELQKLLNKGYDDKELCKRALALTDGNVEDAIAILDAEAADELEEQNKQKNQQNQQEAKESANGFKTIDVAAPANFDPAGLPSQPQQQQQPPASASGMSPPPPAAKEDVVFQGTGDNLQKIVMESPVPVLLDVYADWCGPCKALTPVLEEMAIKGGGMFRLVKLNSDEERAISRLLGVEALPTVFGIRDGQVVNSFKGMPRSEEALKSFMMTLLMGTKSSDNGSISDQEEKKQYQEISLKLAKAARMSALPFAVREQIQNRIYSCLDELVKECNGDMVAADKSAQILRQLMSNIIQNPTDPKYRQINLDKPFLADKVGKFVSCIKVLKYSGFHQVEESSNKYAFGSSPTKKIINTAPLSFANSAIDKWCDKNQYNIDAAARKQRDEKARAELADAKPTDDGTVEEEEQVVVEDKSHLAILKIRISGKKKVHTVELEHENTLQNVLEQLSIGVETTENAEDDSSIQITCAAKKLVVSSTDESLMSKTLRDLGLVPKASLVIQLPSASLSEEESTPVSSSSNLKERAAKKKKKTGSHTMQSIGIYAKDDNAKGNIVDGGGGTCYEQDVTDDEEEQPSPEDP